MIYEVTRDMDIAHNNGFVHYYGRKSGKQGQMILDSEIDPVDMERLIADNAVEQITVVSQPEIKSVINPKETVKDEPEKYHCEKCGKNHLADSKIGKEHRES